MYIQLQPLQIPQYWEVIKYASLMSGTVSQKDQVAYCRNLLIDLLASKVSCIMHLDPETRNIISILLYQIHVDNFNPEVKSAYIDTLYMFDESRINELKDFLEKLIMILTDQQC